MALTTILRRLRAVLVTACLWAVAWVALGTLYGAFWFVVARLPLSISTMAKLLVRQGVVWAIWGAITGAVFALLFIAGERHRAIGQLSLRRAGLWGGMGGALVAVVTVAAAAIANPAFVVSLRLPFVAAGVSGLIGAGLATVQVAIAKRALPRGDTHEPLVRSAT